MCRLSMFMRYNCNFAMDRRFAILIAGHVHLSDEVWYEAYWKTPLSTIVLHSCLIRSHIRFFFASYSADVRMATSQSSTLNASCIANWSGKVHSSYIRTTAQYTDARYVPLRDQWNWALVSNSPNIKGGWSLVTGKTAHLFASIARIL